MQVNPLWNLWDNGINYPKLTDDLEVDVGIIGGGITGLLTALLLSENGYRIALAEIKSIGKGTTGQSTGNLYEITEDLFSTLFTKYDKETIKQIFQARRQGIKLIRDCIEHFDINCDYRDTNMYIFEEGDTHHLPKEREIAREVRINVTALPLDFPLPYEEGFFLKNQAQFNPLIFAQELAKRIHSDRCQLFENTVIQEISQEKGLFILKSSEGKRITSRYVIEATHTPKGLQPEFHTTLGPYREYGIAAQLQPGHYPEDGIYWKYHDHEKYSFRTYKRGEDIFLIGIGKSHKVGQAENTSSLLENLMEYTGRIFPIERVKYCWGGQNYKPASYLPYIGRVAKSSNRYIATGFSADGLVYGAVAARIINDSVCDIENPFAKLFRADRKRFVKSAERFVKENVNVAAQFVKDIAIADKNVEEIPVGKGKVVKINGERAAVFRKDQYTLLKVSAVCPHMGCTVRWNDAEQTWDCHCHGSRFRPDGEFIEGPSFSNLPSLEE